MLPACGKSAVVPVMAVGKVGGGLTSHVHATPRGAQVCAYKAALEANAQQSKTPTSEQCAKASTSDALWRRSVIVLAAYGESLEALGNRGEPEATGKLEAELTGVRETVWITVDDAKEKAARDAVAQLVTQMNGRTSKTDIEQAVNDAAPHVKTLCDGLNAYFQTQLTDLADLQKQIEEKRASPTTRRCAMLDTRAICVADSATDRISYANALGDLASLEASHQYARDSIAGFCGAFGALADAAANGKVSDKATYDAVVQAARKAVGKPKAK